MGIKAEKGGVLPYLGDIPEGIKVQWHEDTSAGVLDEDIKGRFGFFEIAEICWDNAYDKGSLRNEETRRSKNEWS